MEIEKKANISIEIIGYRSEEAGKGSVQKK
jgi:hypothetical protein